MSILTVIGATAEIANVANFRNSVLYGDKVNSIAEWMLSPEWTTPTDDYGARGLIAQSGSVVYANTSSGEFNAATCHCHKSNGDSWSLCSLDSSRHNP